jgi:ABC-type multidrug transport system permease subunit
MNIIFYKNRIIRRIKKNKTKYSNNNIHFFVAKTIIIGLKKSKFMSILNVENLIRQKKNSAFLQNINDTKTNTKITS